MSVINITLDNFESEVLKSDKLVLVDFWAAWCAPCRMVAPVLDEIAAQCQDVKVCKVNVDENGEIASKFNIKGIPTLILFKDSEVVVRETGAKSKPEILEMMEL